MAEYILSPEFEDEVRTVMAVPAASPEFVDDLRNRLSSIAAEQNTHKSPIRRLRPAWTIALALVFILAVTTAVIGPQRVLAAIRGLFGYLPGIGLVQEGADLRLLAEPVLVEREGITLSVEQAATDGQRTVIVYQADGLSRQGANSHDEAERRGQGEPLRQPELRLPDGTILEGVGTDGNSWAVGYQLRLVFPPLPSDVNEATLVIQRLMNMPAGAAPEDWQLPLRFEPAPPDMELMPVYELGTPEPPSTGPDGSTDAAQSNVAIERGVRFTLERVVELEDSYVFQGHISWEGLEGVTYVSPHWNSFVLTDANGQNVPVEEVSPDDVAEGDAVQRYSWALQTNSKGYPGPWTLSLPSLMIDVNAQVPFQIDLGPDPELGQTWEVNQTLEVPGYSIRFTMVELYQDSEERIWLAFTIETGSEVYSVDLSDQDVSALTGHGKGEIDQDGRLISAFAYKQIPTGVRQINIGRIGFTLDGPWQVTWQPPVSSAAPFPTPTPQTQACLTPDKWEQLKDQPPAPLPDGLGGQMLLKVSVGQNLPMIFLASPDGVQRQDIAIGTWPSLSPDRSTLAFSGNEGLSLADVATGQVTHFSGSTQDDEYLVWSPDGNWIAFKRLSDEAIYRAHPDGSGLQLVYQNPDIVNLSDWLPDGRIIYEAFSQEGIVIRAVDVETGAVEDLVLSKDRKPRSNYAFSPDGQRVAFASQVFGQSYQGIYLTRPGDPDWRLLVSVENHVFIVGDWSPDGEWLAVTFYGSNPSSPPELIPILINPDTCQVIVLPDIQGEVVSWGAD